LAPSQHSNSPSDLANFPIEDVDPVHLVVLNERLQAWTEDRTRNANG